MKNKIPVVSFLLAGLAFLASRPIIAAEKSGEWVRIPGNWLIHRFVRPATAPAHTYRVAVVIPPPAGRRRKWRSPPGTDDAKVFDESDLPLDLQRA